MSKKQIPLAIFVGFLVALAALVLWSFLKTDPPSEVSIDSAVQNTVGHSGTFSDAVTEGTLSGHWVVDTETGEFNYETASGSFAGFRIDEELRGIGAVTAVGRTGEVFGNMKLDAARVTSAVFEVDLRTITTETARRDDNVQEILETSDFPKATFTLNSFIDLDEAALIAGNNLSTIAKGELRIHGVTKSVDINLDVALKNNRLVIVGSIPLLLSDFELDVPKVGPVLSASDTAIMEVQLLLAKQ